MLITILVIILLIALLSGPNWGWSSGWGWGPSGLLWTIFLVILILYLLHIV